MAKRLAARRGYCTFPYNYCDVPMSSNYPCPATRRVPTDPQNASGQKMSSGSKVIVQDNGQATSLVGYYIDAGARYESRAQAGVADFVTKMMFRSNLQSSDFQVYKTFQHAGANYWSNQVNGRYIGVKVECRRDTVNEVVARLTENLVIPRFAPHEMNLVREILDNNHATKTHDQKAYALKQFAKTAFSASSLANDEDCPGFNVDTITHDDLINWWGTYFTPERVTLAGVNISAEELSAAYEKSEWSTANTADHPSHKNANIATEVNQVGAYMGGNTHEFFRKSEAFKNQQFYNDVYVSYGRQGMGSASIKDFASMLVATGNVGASVGTGFGTEGLLKSFEGTSVVGGMVRCRPEHADVAAKNLAASVNATGSLAGSELEAAKKVAAVNFLSSTNTREGLLDFLVLHSGTASIGKTVPAVLQAISDVTAADMKKLGDVMGASAPTYTAFGDLSTVPSIRDL
eukprot:TRINITY_DN6650_c0_g3_i3.p2 TRINITY_DN6650_c0_g3~~TRINITY_DN6650_c0_g3_i3.p2  ORF type:complete len:477 (+),score=152.43 TRINITY_DN6650_c0_g3_i3:50-1432(+)